MKVAYHGIEGMIIFSVLNQADVSVQVASEQSPSDPPGTAGMKQGTPVSTPADIRDAEAAASGNGAGRIGHGHGSIAAVTTLCVALVIAAVVS